MPSIVDRLMWYDPKDNLVLVASPAEVRARQYGPIRASAGLHFSIENSPAWQMVGVPTRRMAGDGPGLALAL
jgi:hypothetical protein